jgi:hypothetical protein
VSHKPETKSSAAHRLQWRDRVGVAPTSRGRRGERQVVNQDYTRLHRTRLFHYHTVFAPFTIERTAQHE